MPPSPNPQSVQAHRFPRSLAASPDFDPSWRFLQVEEYIRCHNIAEQTGTVFRLPRDEKDSWIRDYFAFRTQEPNRRNDRFDYAEACCVGNSRTAMASRIKAMTVAGMLPEEIARRIGTDVSNVDLFLKIFWDLADCMASPDQLRSVIVPLMDLPQTDPRERVWLLGALHLGRHGLDFLMDRKIRLSQANQEELANAIQVVLGQQTLAYVLARGSDPKNGVEMLPHYHRGLDVQRRNPPGDDSRTAAFNAAAAPLLRDRLKEYAAQHGYGAVVTDDVEAA